MELLIPGAIGLAAGLLGGLLGVGGSLIIIPGMILYLSHTPDGYAGGSQHLLQAAAMICNPFVVAPSVIAHWRARAIMKSVVLLLIPVAGAGILLGVGASNTSIFAREKGAYLAMVLAGFLLYVVVYNTWRLFTKTDLTKHSDEPRKLPAWKLIAVGLPMGFMAGLLGIGGGALCVPLQQVLLRIPLRRAIANSALTIVFVSPIGAFLKNVTLLEHDVSIIASLQLALTLIPTAMLGSYIGGRLTHALPRRVLRVVFIAFMMTMAYLTFDRAWEAAAASKTQRVRRAVPADPVGSLSPAET